MRNLSVISFKNLSRKNPTPAFELEQKTKPKPGGEKKTQALDYPYLS
jgi:hypothetical protein